MCGGTFDACGTAAEETGADRTDDSEAACSVGVCRSEAGGSKNPTSIYARTKRTKGRNTRRTKDVGMTDLPRCSGAMSKKGSTYKVEPGM